MSERGKDTEGDKQGSAKLSLQELVGEDGKECGRRVKDHAVATGCLSGVWDFFPSAASLAAGKGKSAELSTAREQAALSKDAADGDCCLPCVTWCWL